MVTDSSEEYLETIAGYIFDDDKLVTYKWLSKELKIHVNVAKQILWEFWQRYKEQKDFDSTFLLMGILHDNGMHVEVVKEKDLQTAKEKYNKVISEHIYSLQKVLPEIQLLGITEDGDIRYSAIKCIENNERSDEEMHILRWGVISNEIQPVGQEKAQVVSKSAEPKHVISPKEKQTNKKKNAEKKGFDNLFGTSINKQKSSSVSSNAEKVEIETFNHMKQKSTNVAPEFSKKTTQKDKLNSFFHRSKNQTNIIDSSDQNKSTNCIEKESINEKIILKNNDKQKKNVHSRKRNRSKDDSNTIKKRKRIMIQSDSADTESSDEQEEQLEISPSPENVSPVKERHVSPPQIKHENGKRKVLKIVDKTFEEDGFLVTKKVHVYESCSEDEPEIIELKKPVTTESHSEVKGKKNTKQTSLMNFFKKS